MHLSLVLGRQFVGKQFLHLSLRLRTLQFKTAVLPHQSVRRAAEAAVVGEAEPNLEYVAVRFQRVPAPGFGLALFAPAHRPVRIMLHVLRRDEGELLADEFGDQPIGLTGYFHRPGGQDAVEARGRGNSFPQLEPSVASLRTLLFTEYFQGFTPFLRRLSSTRALVKPGMVS